MGFKHRNEINPLLFFSSILDWGKNGRYEVDKIFSEETLRKRHGVDEDNITSIEDMIPLEDTENFYCLCIDHNLAKFAVSSLSELIPSIKRKTCKDDVERLNFIERLSQSEMLATHDNELKCIERNSMLLPVSLKYKCSKCHKIFIRHGNYK